jgi:hypothetical protein
MKLNELLEAVEEKQYEIIRDGNGYAKPGEQVDADFFLDQYMSPCYLRGANRKRFKAMQIGDQETFSDPGYWDPITVKRVS